MIITNEIFLPPPDMMISEWADEFRELPPEASSEPGHWSTSRAPYQREMMNAICPPSAEKVVFMTAAQVGKTEIILNTIGYYIHKEPSPILVMQPTLQMGESFSKDRLSTMLRDCTCLHGKVKDPRARDSGNTLLHKTFPGGHITIAGANSPASLASRPIRVLLCDEADRYPPSAGTEGDPLSLAVKRTQNFWNRKIIIVSTPTVKGYSRIESEYEDTTREEWELPCPKCGKYNALDWERVIYDGKTEPLMRCRECGYETNGTGWKSQSHKGRWHANNESKVRGFHVNALASPWVSWPEIVTQYEESRRSGPEKLKVWTNTVLGLPYEETAGTVNIDTMTDHEEEYGAELPDEVLLLTAGIDTQDNRLEIEILGHGQNGDTYGIEYRRFYGNPGSAALWKKLDEYLSREWHYADGDSLKVSCACIDSGGHFTDEVYDFCRDKARRNIFPVKGRGGYGLPGVSRPTVQKHGVYLFLLGVSTIKGELFTRLNARRGEPGYCYFPKDDSKGYDGMYYYGLLSERMVVKRRGGQEYVTWEERTRSVRNEPLDCRVYALGAFKILNPDMTRHKRKAESRAESKAQSAAMMQPKRIMRPRVIRRGFAI